MDPEREEEMLEAVEVAWAVRSPVQDLWVNVYALLAEQQPLIRLECHATSSGAQSAEHPWSGNRIVSEIES